MMTRRELVQAGVVAAGASAAAGPALTQSRARVIDVHTHMYPAAWVDAVDAAKDPDFHITPGPKRDFIERGTYFGTLSPSFQDYDLRLRKMDEAGVDVAILSLSAPNVYFGTREISLRAARVANDDFAAAERKYGGRIRWMASLPFEHIDDALVELRRAKALGAVGVCTLTNIKGVALTDPRFDPLWREIEAIGLPVFVHPTFPYVEGLDLSKHGLGNTIGFTTESSLCFARMIVEGWLDRFPKLQLVACHGGGALPYLIKRLDRMWEINVRDKREIQQPPSTYLRRIHFDAIVYDQATLEFLVAAVGHDRVLYGSDYPFPLGDMKGVLARVDALPDAQRDAVRSGNIVKIFDLG